MKLFCIPYAGGSDLVYYKWKKFFEEKDIIVEPISLKGRGYRIREGFYENVDESIEDIYTQIKSKLDGRDYCIFGHSMGAVLAYEVYYKIINNKLKKPNHMFFGGKAAPYIKKKPIIDYTKDDMEVMKNLIDLGGMPKRVLDNSRAFNILIPIIKSDFDMMDKYTYEPKNELISCDVSIINGIQDRITQSDKDGWKTLCSSKVEIKDFNGGHFFINSEKEEVLSYISKIIMKY